MDEVISALEQLVRAVAKLPRPRKDLVFDLVFFARNLETEASPTWVRALAGIKWNDVGALDDGIEVAVEMMPLPGDEEE